VLKNYFFLHFLYFYVFFKEKMNNLNFFSLKVQIAHFIYKGL